MVGTRRTWHTMFWSALKSTLTPTQGSSTPTQSIEKGLFIVRTYEKPSVGNTARDRPFVSGSQAWSYRVFVLMYTLTVRYVFAIV